MGRKKKFRGGDDEPMIGLDAVWESPAVIIGTLGLGLFILSIIVWAVFNYSKVKINNIWISLLIAIPTTILLNEIFVGNSLWRTDEGGKSLRLGSIPITLLSPLYIFGITGFSNLPLWGPMHFVTSNVYVIWWATFLTLTYIRK